MPCGVATLNSGGPDCGVVVKRSFGGPLEDMARPFCDNGEGLGDARDPGIDNDNAGERALEILEARVGATLTGGLDKGAGAAGGVEVGIAVVLFGRVCGMSMNDNERDYLLIFQC